MTEKGFRLVRLLRGGRKIKLCRIETLQGAKLALEAELDFIGLHIIYRLSRRRRAVFSQIVDLLTHARRADSGTLSSICNPVIVTRSQNLRAIANWCRQLRLDCVQIQNPDVLPGAVRTWQRRMTPKRNVEVIKAVVLSSANDIPKVERWAGVAQAVLFDSSSTGGSGERANWTRIRHARSLIRMIPTFIAGGIEPKTARAAMRETGTDAVDIQSHCEIERPRARTHAGRPRRRKRKHVRAVLEACANVRGETERRVRREYILRRADSRLLFSVADLRPSVASRCTSLSENLLLDGIQIDASDGSFVPTWPRSAARHASMVWSQAPECPIWLHLFAMDLGWVIATIREVVSSNAHLVGVALQCPPTFDGIEWLRKLHSLTHSIKDALIVPSFSAGQICEASASFGRWLRRTAELSGRTVLVTLPSADRTISKRIEATRLAISMIRKATRDSQKPWRVGIDRKVTLDLVRSLSPRPDFVVVGSALSNGNFSANTRAFRRLLS
jgi:phosphoribosylanthranilate isomerase